MEQRVVVDLTCSSPIDQVPSTIVLRGGQATGQNVSTTHESRNTKGTNVQNAAPSRNTDGREKRRTRDSRNYDDSRMRSNSDTRRSYNRDTRSVRNDRNVRSDRDTRDRRSNSDRRNARTSNFRSEKYRDSRFQDCEVDSRRASAQKGRSNNQNTGDQQQQLTHETQRPQTQGPFKVPSTVGLRRHSSAHFQNRGLPKDGSKAATFTQPVNFPQPPLVYTHRPFFQPINNLHQFPPPHTPGMFVQSVMQ